MPEAAAYHNNLALVLKDMDKLDEAVTEEQEAIKIKPYRGDYHYNLGLILQRQSQFEQAKMNLVKPQKKNRSTQNFITAWAQC